ncbi:MAG: MFS transporter [Clostridiales bacterium]|nr:MFS transporter [Clostridiales bacterium]
MLVAIFIAYIGLGIPDSLLGSAWPAIYTELGVNISCLSAVSIIISAGTIISSFASERIVKKLKTPLVAVLSTALTVIALLGFSLSKNMVWLCFCAIPQGLGAGAIDAALNNYVAHNYKATHMNFLHGFYGVGVAVSPYIMAAFLKNGMQWRQGYRTLFYMQGAILIIIILSLPFWKMARSAESIEKSRAQRPIKFSALIKNSAVRTQWVTFIGSCGIESLCLVWGSTYLVNSQGVSADYGAKIITFYYAGLTLSRLGAGFIVKKISSEKIVFAGQAITFAAIVILLWANNAAAAGAGLFLVGLGNGPFFPNMTRLTVEYFDSELSQAIIGTQMGFGYTSILLTPVMFGIISNIFSTAAFPFYLGVCFAIMLAATLSLKKKVSRRS